MNVLFLNSIEPRTYGGMEEWIRLVSAGLARKGHRIIVAGRENSEYLRRISKTSTEVDILPLHIAGDFNPLTIKRLRHHISTEGIDVLVVNFNKDVRLGGLAARWHGKARVVWSVGLDITKNRFIHKFLTPKLIDGVIAPSEALKRQITRYGYIDNRIVKVIPIGIPPASIDIPRNSAREALNQKYGFTDDCIISVTSGRFVNQKGHYYLIEAARKIVKRHPRVKFLFLGDGPLKQRLINQIDALHLKDNFVLAGMLDNLETELAGADLMIHPSVEEPFGIAILEGMRAGLPVVAANVGGIPEVVCENSTAALVEPRNHDKLAAAVIDLLDSPQQLEKLGRAGYERWKNNFQLEQMIDSVEKYLMGFTRC
jgi:glycosyltransferase involved in cell wall biosynthesis